jgi:hypothetical protein
MPGTGCRDRQQVEVSSDTGWRNSEGSLRMAAMKPRTGDGPLEAAKEGRGIVVRIPIEGGGRLVVESTADEAAALGEELRGVAG